MPMKRSIWLLAIAGSALVNSQSKAQYYYNSSFNVNSAASSIATDGTYLYTTDSGQSSIFKYTESGSYVGSLNGGGRVTSPGGIATDGVSVYVYNGNEKTFNAISAQNSSAGLSGSSGIGSNPNGVAAAGGGPDAYFLGNVNNGSGQQIYQYNFIGQSLTSVTAPTTNGIYLYGLARDSSGHFYTLGYDPNNSSGERYIYKFNSDGSLAASVSTGYFSNITVDGNGNVFVTGDNIHAFEEFNSNLSFVTSASLPPGNIGNGPYPGGNGQFNSIAVDGRDNVFLGLSDDGNPYGTIVKYTTSPQAVPEPSSFIVCGLLASGVGAYLWRRSRKTTVAVPTLA
jgi:hypothetical protein